MCRFPFVLGFILLGSSVHAQTSIRTELIEKAKPSVVWVHCFGWPTVIGRGGYATGTGYVVEGGLVITNHHVIRDATGIIIYGSSEKDVSLVAYPVWSDSTLDLAVLQTIDRLTLPALEIADLGEIKIGQDILILGFPGESYKPGSIKVTRGIISNNPEDSTIQVDAPVNPGNSGGPCIGFSGKVVGTVYAKSVGYEIEGIGYLRSSRFVKDAVTKAKKLLNEKSTFGFIGTSDIEAYRNLCEAQELLWRAKGTSNTSEMRSKIKDAKRLLLNAIDRDRNFASAHFFLAAFFLEEALTYCLERRDKEANSSADNVNKELQKATTLKPSLEYNDNAKLMREIVTRSKIDCEALRKYLAEQKSLEGEKGQRVFEILQYLLYGKTPEILRKTLVWTGYTSVLQSEEEVQRNEFERVIEYLSPAISYSISYLGKPLFEKNQDVSIRDFQLSANLHKNIRVNWGLFLPKTGDHVGYLGVQLRTVFANFSYNLDDKETLIPSWMAGLCLDGSTTSWYLATGQMKVVTQSQVQTLIGNIRYLVPSYELKKTFLAFLKLEFSLVDPIGLLLSGTYPFKNGKEYYQIGVGVSLRFH